jgi:hypothetical protein
MRIRAGWPKTVIKNAELTSAWFHFEWSGSLPLLCSPLFQLPQDNLIRRLILLGITARSRLVPTLQMNFNILIVLIDDGMFRPSRSPRLSLLVRREDGRSSPSAPTG